MTNQQLLAIAQEYRERYQDNHPCMLSSGYVRIYQGEAYGWCAEKGEANTECPEALLVSFRSKERLHPLDVKKIPLKVISEGF
ncbi:hypothetical protein [Mannheimia haemolytica]|uniref:hypothetical protein n=1 Tax=Mannheimia haemolytica TaxID=75985 RepID=UPI0005C87BDA|nr:hypothetical protein [Mannheimia haemolytica]UQX69000.1 hypothetical protein M3705_08325 [Mannheimia haemolytica]